MCTQALFRAELHAVHSGPSHNSLCLATPPPQRQLVIYIALYESSDTMSDGTKSLQPLLMDIGVAGQIGEVAAKPATMVLEDDFEGVTIPLPLMGEKIAKVMGMGTKCVF